MMKITIKARFTDSIKFEGEYESAKHACEQNKANLYGANLYGANLRGADLRGANLYGANLRGADLRGADLCGANLRVANLYGANLCEADLRGANLYGANLRGANLRGANLRGANLRGANLYGANLYGATGEKIATIFRAIQVGPCGSRKDYLVAYDTDKGTYINAGCFFGTEKEFAKRVKETHAGNAHVKEYAAVLKFIKASFAAHKAKESEAA